MWICENCGQDFDSPDEIETTYEAYYGVGSEFGSRTPMTLLVCPYCREETIVEDDEDDEEEE